MISADSFIRQLRQAGFGLFSGVPCSYLTPLINKVIDSPDARYIGAANEGEAVAIACGAQLGGTRGAAMFQNSGLGNAVSPLTSLTAVFRIPVLLIVTWRGQPGGPADEPQHELMGGITPELLTLMGVAWEPFPSGEADVAAVIGRAVDHMEQHSTPYALVMEKGAVEPYQLAAPGSDGTNFELDALPTGRTTVTPFDPDDVLAAIQAHVDDFDILLATTGFTGRALYALGDRPNQLYMAGSMGCVSSLGLGLATVLPERRVIVIDGDGALLMRMGALAVVGHERPGNLIHVVLDNSVHDSTGSQATVSPTVDLATLAAACGYPNTRRVGDLDDLAAELSDASGGLRFLHVRTDPRRERKLPRPTITPAEVAGRLQHWIGVHACVPTNACCY